MIPRLETLTPIQEGDELTAYGGFEFIVNEGGNPSFMDRSDIGNRYLVHQVLTAEGSHVGMQEWMVTILDSCKSSLITLDGSLVSPTIPNDNDVTRENFLTNGLVEIDVVTVLTYQFTDSAYFNTDVAHQLNYEDTPCKTVKFTAVTIEDDKVSLAEDG